MKFRENGREGQEQTLFLNCASQPLLHFCSLHCKGIAPGIRKGRDSYPPASNVFCKQHFIRGDLSVITIGGSCNKLSSLAFPFTCSHLTLVFLGFELCEVASVHVICVS